MLKWAREHGCPWDESTCAAAAGEEQSTVLPDVQGGHLEVLQWAREQDPPCPWNSRVCHAAAERGNSEVLQWARDQGCPWDEDRMCELAAKGGHLDVLQWAREQNPPCPWNSEVCSAAAGGGHLDVLQWAREQGCPWDSRTIAAAEKNGFQDVLTWAKEHGCPEPMVQDDEEVGAPAWAGLGGMAGHYGIPDGPALWASWQAHLQAHPEFHQPA